MKRLISVLIISLILAPAVLSYQMKDCSDHMEIGLGYSMTSAISLPVTEVQFLFNASRNFYLGLRYVNMPGLYYDSATSTAVAYNDSFNAAEAVFGAQFGEINERYNVFFNVLPGFAFVKRDRDLVAYSGEKRYTNTRDVVSVISTKSFTMFTPAVELGFSGCLTDNFILTASIVIRSYDVEDMNWKYDFWLVKTGDKNAFLLYVPLRLDWRF